jgi:hypothetical protein
MTEMPASLYFLFYRTFVLHSNANGYCNFLIHKKDIKISEDFSVTLVFGAKNSDKQVVPAMRLQFKSSMFADDKAHSAKFLKIDDIFDQKNKYLTDNTLEIYISVRIAFSIASCISK